MSGTRAQTAKPRRKRLPHHRTPDRCPVCGGESDCIESRPGAAWTRRRYQCRVCAQRWTTRETVLPVDARRDEGPGDPGVWA